MYGPQDLRNYQNTMDYQKYTDLALTFIGQYALNVVVAILILIIGTFFITYEFDKSGDFGILVNFATSISFLIAPIIAIFNYLVVNRYLDNKFVPPKWLNYLSIIGVLYLILFSILYLFKNYLFT